MHAPTSHVINAPCHCALYLQDGGIASGQRAMQSAADQFRQLHSYLMRFMRSKAIKIGETDALEYLVMRLEFNNFYRAD